MYSSELGWFSQDTSVIIAIIVVAEAHRILTKRPTVARASLTGIGPEASSPTRASEPRTEITRPKDVTVFNLMNWSPAAIMGSRD